MFLKCHINILLQSIIVLVFKETFIRKIKRFMTGEDIYATFTAHIT